MNRRRPAFALHRAALAAALILLYAPCTAAREVWLAWDANSEADLAGYGVYFRPHGEGPPYDLYGYVTLAELADQSAPTFEVAGLEDHLRYCFTATAYNTSGLESGFSNSVCAEPLKQEATATPPADSAPQEPAAPAPPKAQPTGAAPVENSQPPAPEPPPAVDRNPTPLPPEPNQDSDPAPAIAPAPEAAPPPPADNQSARSEPVPEPPDRGHSGGERGRFGALESFWGRLIEWVRALLALLIGRR